VARFRIPASGSRALKRCGWLLSFSILLWATVIVSPKLLAFPYKVQIDEQTVFAETPIPHEISGIIARSEGLLKQSKIYAPDLEKEIYLTKGGWRWRILSFPTSPNAFGLSRPWIGSIVINRNDVIANKVFSKASNGRTRTLADTIAHEQTHGLLIAHFGINVLSSPTWKIEGYCDYVAQNSSLNAQQATSWEKTNPDHPALVYFHGRNRVAAILSTNGGSVDQLFKE
jgi:hypothetical protein